MHQKRFSFSLFKYVTVAHNAFKSSTEGLHVAELWGGFEVCCSDVARCCSCAERTQQFHQFHYLPACFGLWNMLFVVFWLLVACLSG